MSLECGEYDCTCVTGASGKHAETCPANPHAPFCTCGYYDGIRDGHARDCSFFLWSESRLRQKSTRRVVGRSIAPTREASIYERPITHHGGAKYLRTIHPADGQGSPIKVDVYCVIEAYRITCPALQHALKKILACGERGKGSKVDDLHGVFDAMWRALELQKQREKADAGNPTDQ